MSLSGLLVTGTDTGVGKTRIAAAIAHCLRHAGRRVGVLKPVATGVEARDGRLWIEDAEMLLKGAGSPVDVPIDRVTPLAFEPPLAPPVAARAMGSRLRFADVLREVDVALDWWTQRADVMIVEGVGGFLCPLAEDATVADLAVALDLPVLIVARWGLGTLNHTLLTVEAVKRRALRTVGIVLNGAQPFVPGLAETTAAEELARRLSDVPILAELPYQRDPDILWEGVRDVDWYGWCRSSRGPGRPPGRPTGS